MNRSSLGLGGFLFIGATSAVVFACSSSTTDTPAAPAAGTTQSTAAAVSGAADTHCGTTVVKVDPSACHPADAGGDDTDAGGDDTDAGGGGGGDDDDFGATLYGSAGNDDDCKYHVSWTSSPVSENTGVTFVVTVANLVDNTPVTGSNPYIEAFLDEHTPAPNSNPATTEKTGGIYTIGPILFDKPGKWTVRFHIAGDCADSDDSPHGHAAFFVAVP